MPDAFRSRGDEELHPRNVDILFQTQIHKDLQCSVCLDIFRDPNQTSCGHRFCRVCTEELGKLSRVNGYIKCPLCQTWFCRRTEVFPDRAIQRTVGDLQVTCYRKECVWAGSYSDLKRRHIGISCDEDVVECPNECRSMLFSDGYDRAMQQFFDRRGQTLKNGSTLDDIAVFEERQDQADIEEAEKSSSFDQLFLPGIFRMFRNQTSLHRSGCRDEKVTCLLCNQGGIKRKFLMNHQFFYCGKLKMYCEFCGMRDIERKRMEKHFNEFHSQLAIEQQQQQQQLLLRDPTVLQTHRTPLAVQNQGLKESPPSEMGTGQPEEGSEEREAGQWPEGYKGEASKEQQQQRKRE